MKIYQLLLQTKTIKNEVSFQILETIKNGQQLHEIATSLNNKHKKDAKGNDVSFIVNEIDTTTIVDSLNNKEIKNIY